MNLKHEFQIVWLKEPKGYDYLRETTIISNFRKRICKCDLLSGENTDGGQGAHTVAIAVLADSAPNDGSPGTFQRRIWWVKEYDRFPGRKPVKSGAYDDIVSAPAEAVNIRTIKAGKPSESWNPDKG